MASVRFAFRHVASRPRGLGQVPARPQSSVLALRQEESSSIPSTSLDAAHRSAAATTGSTRVNKLTPELRLPPAAASLDERSPHDVRRSTAADAPGPPQGDARLQSLRSRLQRPQTIRRAARTPQSRERLGRLRWELGRIQPPPADPEAARNEILKALARAGLSEWTVPELSDPMTSRSHDGSAVLRLLAHIVVINPSGAFRIVDMHSLQALYFEMRAANGSAFSMPRDL
jgi:hypothetical protein